jgi:hypothetical protein
LENLINNYKFKSKSKERIIRKKNNNNNNLNFEENLKEKINDIYKTNNNNNNLNDYYINKYRNLNYKISSFYLNIKSQEKNNINNNEYNKDDNYDNYDNNNNTSSNKKIPLLDLININEKNFKEKEKDSDIDKDKENDNNYNSNNNNTYINNNNLTERNIIKKLKQKYNLLFKSTLSALIDIIEILIINKPSNVNGDSVNKVNNNENIISFSIDIFDPYYCEDDKRAFFIDQIINILLTKIKYIQNYSGFNLDKEISKIKSWIVLLNKENNNSSMFNTSNTRMINNKNSYKDLSIFSCN